MQKDSLDGAASTPHTSRPIHHTPYTLDDGYYTGETLRVSEALTLINDTLEQTIPAIIVEGEISGFKVSQGKWVFFDIKDEDSTLNCFMPVFGLNVPLEDGMKARVLAVPKLTKWGRFSLTVKQVELAGEGSIKKAYQILKKKLEGEGLFEASRKRPIPEFPEKIGVITSSAAAGWQDFKKLIDERWAGLDIKQVNVAVQGIDSPRQIIKAIEYFNQSSSPVDLIVIVRGGGSIEDLAGFNDEKLVRSITASRTPVVVGVGHENDETLASLAADVSAATPTHAATLIVSDKKDFLDSVDSDLHFLSGKISQHVVDLRSVLGDADRAITDYFRNYAEQFDFIIKRLSAYDPKAILSRGYALVKEANGGNITKGSDIIVTTEKQLIKAKVQEVK